MDSSKDYKQQFLEDLRREADLDGTDTHDEFLTKTLNLLQDYDEIQDTYRINIGDKRCSGQRIMRADAYGFDNADNSLELFISDFVDSKETGNITSSRVDELYWRMFYFLDETCNGKIDTYFDDSDETLSIARYLKGRMLEGIESDQRILKIKLYIITNKDLSVDLLNKNLLVTEVKSKNKSQKYKSTRKTKKDEFNGRPVELNIWSLDQFYEKELSLSNNPVVINFADDYEYEGIPCLKGHLGEDTGYEAYLAIIPGKILADIYIDYGSRVLEGNVRAFLGTSGSKSVNSGIKRTINSEADKFFTYNNGIATTAANVETVSKDGQLFISKIVDLQIINGGQTTAALAEAVLKKTNTELNGIFVPMKVTVIEDRETENEDGVRFYDQMVQNIARYANTQNKVTAADLFSNDPFHIWMERMSKNISAPAVRYSVSTNWYYERSRKKYQQEIFKRTSTLDKKRFQAKFPTDQIITKEQLSMYSTAVEDMRPDIVSKGKGFAMKEFNTIIGERMRKNKDSFNEFYYKKCVCYAIIYRTVDDYLEKNKDSARHPTGFWYKVGGYKGNIVPYTVSKIMSCIPDDMSLDWNLIWKKQAVPIGFMHEIEVITKMADDFIKDSGGIIVTEYCKHIETWKAFRAVPYTPSRQFRHELVSKAYVAEQEKAAQQTQKSIDDMQSVLTFIGNGSESWKKLRDEGIRCSALGYSDQYFLEQVIDFIEKNEVPFSSSGKIPNKTKAMIKRAYDIKDHLATLGITVE